MSQSGWSVRYFLKQLVPPLFVSIKRSFQPQPRVEKQFFGYALDFSTDWFSRQQPNWEHFLDRMKPSRVLEIGSLEGMSTCFLIERIASARKLEIHCVDSWEGGIEHQEGGTVPIKMGAVERRFRENTARVVSAAPHNVDLHVYKSLSHRALSKLIVDGKEGYFDLIYIDGSHQAPDVLADAVMSFKLLRPGGILIFDDYLWEEPLPGGTDPLRCPKPAIDAFVNINIRALTVLSAPLYQLYVQKLDSEAA